MEAYDYYIQDIAKRCGPLLSKEEEIVLSKRIQKAVENIKNVLLSYPEAWEFICNRFLSLKEEGKTVTRLSEFYGTGAVSAKDMEEKISNCVLILDALVQKYAEDPDESTVRRIFSVCDAACLSRELYFEMIDHIALDSKDEGYIEEQLKEIENSRGTLVTCNLRLVIAFAKKFQGCGIPLTDLIQEGNIGLIRAAERFDHEKERRFTTYAAWWIKQACIKAIKRNSKTIRLPSHIHDLIISISKLREDMKGETGEEPTLTEVAERLNVSETFLIKVMDLQSNPIPLESPVYNDKSKGDGSARVKTMKDLLAIETPNIDEQLDKDKLAELLLAVMKKVLTEREQKVIVSRFGVDGHKEIRLNDLAAQLGKSRERVRQIEANAIKKLRDSRATSRILREFLEDA